MIIIFCVVLFTRIYLHSIVSVRRHFNGSKRTNKTSYVTILLKIIRSLFCIDDIAYLDGQCHFNKYLNDPYSYADWSFYTPGRTSQFRQVEG